MQNAGSAWFGLAVGFELWDIKSIATQQDLETDKSILLIMVQGRKKANESLTEYTSYQSYKCTKSLYIYKSLYSDK